MKHSTLSQNEFNTIRIPAKAKSTWDIKNGDVMYMENIKYVINDTTTREDNVPKNV